MPFEITPLEREHLARGADLVLRRYRQLRSHAPNLPERYASEAVVTGLLDEVVETGLGAVAIQDGDLIGLLGASFLPSIFGRPGAYSPEWANAVVGSADGQRVTDALYTYLAPRWRARGCHSHWVSLFADDDRGLACWNWLGFGMVSVDAVRGLEPPGTPHAVAEVRIARIDDLPHVLRLDQRLYVHLSGSPIYLHDDSRPTAEDYRRWLAGDGPAVWIAEQDHQITAYLTIGPAPEDVCTIVQDEGTASIIAAYTDEAKRGEGVAAALLERALEWARSHGYHRCAVDFEPMNPLARRFWSRYFTPVVFTVVRHLDALEDRSSGS